MSNEKLTLQQLKDMQPDTIFAGGIITDNSEGVNLANTGQELRWVACRGGIHDWAIYAHTSDHDEQWVKQQGDKVHDRDSVQKLVPCDKEALEMYRD